jgi:hypothetical protein
MTARWRVEVLHPVTGRPKLWATHDTREAAEIEAAKLRAHRMFAQVRRIDDEQPEHNGERRAFLIWACMLGAVPRRVSSSASSPKSKARPHRERAR